MQVGVGCPRRPMSTSGGSTGPRIGNAHNMSKRSPKTANRRDGAGNGAARRPVPARLRVIAPNATPEEAAAIVAALERFMRAAAPAPSVPDDAPDAWWRAGILEGTDRDSPGEVREPWMSA